VIGDIAFFPRRAQFMGGMQLNPAMTFLSPARDLFGILHEEKLFELPFELRVTVSEVVHRPRLCRPPSYLTLPATQSAESKTRFSRPSWSQRAETVRREAGLSSFLLPS
jgi:hypothetical protein